MEKKVIEIEIQDNSKTLKQQYKEAVLEVQKLADAFGATSIEVQNASKRAAELKDQIEDVNDAIQAQKGEGAFIALGKSLSTVASGFSAVEGAMGLVGAESEDVQKAMLRVQSAMALAQGLEGLEDAGRAFKQLGAVVKSTTVYTTLYNFVMGVSNKETATNVLVTEADTTAKVGLTGATGGLATVTGGATTAMKLFRVALIATGIGAIVVLVGLLIANFDKVTKVVTTLSGYVIKAYDYFDNLGTAIKVLIGIFFPFIGVVYGAIKALEYFNVIDTKNEREMSARHVANMKRVDKELAKREEQRKARKKAYDEETGNIDRQIKLLEAQGKSTEALEKLQLKRSLTNQRELIKEARLNLQILRATNVGGINDEMIEETLTGIDEMKQAILNTETDIQIARIETGKVTKKTNEEIYTVDDSEMKRREGQREMDAENLKQWLGDMSMAEIKSAKDGIQLLSTTRTTELEIEKNTADKKIEIEKALLQQKKDLQAQDLDLALQGIGIIKSVFEKSKGIQKAGVLAESAIGIAKMIIANKIANAGALATPQAIASSGVSAIPVIARNNISTGLGITANLVATAKALQSLGGGGAPSGVGNLGGDGGGGGVISPNLNVVGNTGINQLATLQQQPVKAYVVSNDITSAQQFDLKVQQTSQL
jgi:enamine deaminase RidA (YjgF/YER057c/UK114 family)